MIRTLLARLARYMVPREPYPGHDLSARDLAEGAWPAPELETPATAEAVAGTGLDDAEALAAAFRTALARPRDRGGDG